MTRRERLIAGFARMSDDELFGLYEDIGRHDYCSELYCDNFDICPFSINGGDEACIIAFKKFIHEEVADDEEV